MQAFPRDLKTIGYNLSFYYGGDIEFFNLKSYLIACGFENIVSDKDFKQERHLSKWGAPDEFVFDRLYDDLSGQNETPYFKVLYTLSNHDPFDIPGKPKFGRSNEDNKFFSAVYYTDSCLNEFVMKLKKSDLWNNTLLILVADHGSRMPGNIPNQAVENFSIPMIWTGGAIRKDSIISKYAMQTDLPKTLLNQLSMDTREYKFSSDIFSCENAGFAHYSYNEGFGFLTDTLKYIFNINSEKLTVNEGKINEYSILSGKSFLQTAYQDFLEY